MGDRASAAAVTTVPVDGTIEGGWAEGVLGGAAAGAAGADADADEGERGCIDPVKSGLTAPENSCWCFFILSWVVCRWPTAHTHHKIHNVTQM